MKPTTLVQADDGRIGTLLTVDRTLDIATVDVWTVHPVFTPAGSDTTYPTSIRVSSLTVIDIGSIESRLSFLTTGRYLPAATKIGA